MSKKRRVDTSVGFMGEIALNKCSPSCSAAATIFSRADLTKWALFKSDFFMSSITLLNCGVLCPDAANPDTNLSIIASLADSGIAFAKALAVPASSSIFDWQEYLQEEVLRVLLGKQWATSWILVPEHSRWLCLWRTSQSQLSHLEVF